MPNYFERFKLRTLGNATTIKEKERLDLIKDFNSYLKEAITSHYVKYTKVNQFPYLDECDTELMSINDMSENDKRAYDEKILLVNNDVDIDVGCYVYFDNCWWVLVYKEHRSVLTYKKFIMKCCNQIINYKVDGIVYHIPMTVQNMTLDYMVSCYRNIAIGNRAKSVRYVVICIVREAKSVKIS